MRLEVQYVAVERGWWQCLCICVQLYLVIYRNSIGPHDAWVDQGNLVWTIQTGAADTGVLTPFSPEEISGQQGSIIKTHSDFCTIVCTWDQETPDAKKYFKPKKSHGLPFLWMYSDGPRLIKSFRYDHWTVCTIQTGDFYEIETMVCPIQVSCFLKKKRKKAIARCANTEEMYWSQDLWRLWTYSYTKSCTHTLTLWMI